MNDHGDDVRKIHRALISVSDKQGVAGLAQNLAAKGVEILSTGGTARLLRDMGIVVVDVSDHTGFPEMMGGRVKTLHPKIHGGVLGRRGVDDDVMRAHGIDAIDLVVVNLYPFGATIDDPQCTLEDAIENIDIGGPALLRSAAKNHADVTVVVDHDDYAVVMAEFNTYQGTGAAMRRRLAAKAFDHTARYDTQIAAYLATQFAAGGSDELVPALPARVTPTLIKTTDMRYGENPHQSAALYVHAGAHDASGSSLANADVVQGKALSYNNLVDADAALACVRSFDSPTCVIVKHANPCGVASAESILDAYDKAYATDPTSAFGGIIAFNRPVDAATAEAIVARQFVEVVVAPEYDGASRDVFANRPNVRVLQVNAAATAGYELKTVDGGVLLQTPDSAMVTDDAVEIVSHKAPTEKQMRDMLFAWRVAKFVKSNAIVFARDSATIGVGAGQMSRVYSTRIAAIKAADAGFNVAESVMASDAFFPFRDGIDQAAEVGIAAVIQPGGSQRDSEVVGAADEHGMAMVFTAMRHFRH